jgi:hypothetical protein
LHSNKAGKSAGGWTFRTSRGGGWSEFPVIFPVSREYRGERFVADCAHRQRGDELFLRGPGFEEKTRVPRTFPDESSPEQRRNSPLIPAIRAFSADFLRALIVEWWFVMHIDEMPPGPRRAPFASSEPTCDRPEAVVESFCTATSIATFDSNPDW